MTCSHAAPPSNFRQLQVSRQNGNHSCRTSKEQALPFEFAAREHPKYLSKVVHNTQKRGIVHHLAEEALHRWSAFFLEKSNR